jgi:ribosome-binding ATPase YchF (GTP1/OBG family)
MNEGKPARSFSVDPADAHRVGQLFLLSYKPILYVANSTGKPEEEKLVEKVKAIAKQENAKFTQIDCALESEIAQLPENERAEYLQGLGIEEPGLHRFIRAAFELLGLITYYTLGPKEARSWTISVGTKAPQAAGVIHSDFERGFICAECYRSEDLLRLGSESKIKEAGLYRQEGKDYVVQTGDVLLFRFNV